MSLTGLRTWLFGTLRGRLVLSVALVHALMMTLFVIDLTIRQRAMILENQANNAAALAHTLALSSAGWLASDDLSGLQELVEARLRYQDTLFVILTDRNGRVLAHTDKTKRGLYLTDLPKEVGQVVLRRSAELVDIAVPAMLGKSHVGWARVGIGQQHAAEKLSAITLMGVVYALAAIVVGSLIAWRMGVHITRRLYAVQNVMARIQAGDNAARAQIAGMDEAASIAREFNEMLDTLQESEAMLKAVTMNSPDHLLVQDRELKYTFVLNPQLGMTIAGMLGKTDYEIGLSKEDADNLTKIKRDVLCGNATETMTLSISNTRGETGYFEGSYMPRRDSSGRIDGIIGYFRNTTERHKTVEALQQSLDRFQTVLDSFGALVYVADMTTHEVLFLNKYGRDAFGDGVGKVCWQTLQSGQTGPCLFCTNNRLLLPDGEPAQPVVWEVRNTVNQHWYECRDQAIRWYDGRLVRMEIATDITARKEAARVLEMAESEWSAAMDASPDAIYLLDGNRRVKRANRAFCQMTSSAPETVIGKHIAELIHPQGESVPCPICAAQEEKRDLALIMEADNPDNPAGVPIEVNCRIIRDKEGKPVSIFMSLHDLSQDRATQAELKRYQEHLEQLVEERTAELEAKFAEIERMNKSFVGRELRMVELKKRIAELEGRTDQEGPASGQK